MSDRVPPHDLDLERMLLGAVLLLPHHIDEIIRTVDASDFYLPVHQSLFAATVSLHMQGHRPDGPAVSDEAALLGHPVPAEVINECQMRATGSWKRPAEAIVRHAAGRRGLAVLLDAVESIYAGVDELAILASTATALSSVDAPLTAVPGDVELMHEFLSREEDEQAPWVIPGLLRQGWRAVLIAGEGLGKSQLIQQFALASAAGIHPLTFKPIPSVVTLMVDLENDAARIRSGVEMIEKRLAGVRRVEGGAWLWSRPGGLDLRQRRDRSTFEAVIAHCRPQLVCLGPIYKSYSAKAAERDELVAKELQEVFDDLRTRYGFALLLEHHAGHGDTKNREMRPYGSSLWLRWPEFGIGLNESTTTRGSLETSRWRGDRLAASWPDRFDRGGPSSWPWVGWWRDGVPGATSEPF